MKILLFAVTCSVGFSTVSGVQLMVVGYGILEIRVGLIDLIR